MTDYFPAPSLDTTRWTSNTVGSGMITVGVPSDGVFITGIDDDGDSALIDSEAKIYTPAGQPFAVNIDYNDLAADPDQVISAFLGWRSTEQDAGIPLYGVDMLISCYPLTGRYWFEKRTTSLDATVWSKIIEDPMDGANGKLRIVRSDYIYSLYSYDRTLTAPDWRKLVDLEMDTNGSGFVTFGYFAFDPLAPSFPNILGP